MERATFFASLHMKVGSSATSKSLHKAAAMCSQVGQEHPNWLDDSRYRDMCQLMPAYAWASVLDSHQTHAAQQDCVVATAAAVAKSIVGDRIDEVEYLVDSACNEQ